MAEHATFTKRGIEAMKPGAPTLHPNGNVLSVSEVKRGDVDPARIALYGGSFGGYLAPRAAAFEHRLAACIADAALFDPAAMSTKMFPQNIASALEKNDVAVLEPFFNKLQENTTLRLMLGRGMWVHGATTPWGYLKMFQRVIARRCSGKHSVSHICG